MTEDNEKEQYIEESKKLQRIVCIVGGIILILIFCPFLLIYFIPAVVFGAVVAIIQIVYALICRSVKKIATTENKISLLPLWLIKTYIIVAGYVNIAIKYYKKDWFRITIIILLMLILFKLFHY